MRKTLLYVLNLWERKKERKKRITDFLENHGLHFIERNETAIVLGCFTGRQGKKTGTKDLLDSNGNVLDENLTETQWTKKIDEYEKAAKKEGISVEEYLSKLVLSNKLKKYKRITNKYPEEALPENGRIISHKIEDGIIVFENNLKTAQSIDFVVTTDGKLIFGKKHHLLGNRKDVLAAGDMKIVNGNIKKISNGSGHYFPTLQEAESFPEILETIGLNLDKAWFELYRLEKGNIKTRTFKIKK